MKDPTMAMDQEVQVGEEGSRLSREGLIAALRGGGHCIREKASVRDPF